MNDTVTEYLSAGIRLICALKTLADRNDSITNHRHLYTGKQLAEITRELPSLRENICRLSLKLEELEKCENNKLAVIFREHGLDTVEKRMCFYVIAEHMPDFIFNDDKFCQITRLDEELKCVVSVSCADGIADSFSALLKYAFSKRLKDIKLFEIDDTFGRVGNFFNMWLMPSALLSYAAFGSYLETDANDRVKSPKEKQKTNIFSRGNSIASYTPKISLKDVILLDEQKKEIDKFIWFYKNRKKTGWDLDDLGTSGNSALFYGPPGTGKTMLADAFGGELKKDVAKVQYESLIDCYVGESEKNIKRVFIHNRDANNILLFDECDAMLESRSSASSSADRMNNRVINILLQELEKYPGIVVFTTNRAVALDPALERRIALKMEVGRPTKEVRRIIWRKMTEGKIPLEDDINWDEVAAIDLSGGEIKNTLMNLAKDPAVNRPDHKVNTADLLRSAKREVSSAFKEKKRAYGFKLE